MFDPAAAVEGGHTFVGDLEADVTEECSKLGTIEKVRVRVVCCARLCACARCVRAASCPSDAAPAHAMHAAALQQRA
jgi:hypothetical protein